MPDGADSEHKAETQTGDDSDDDLYGEVLERGTLVDVL